MTTHSKPDPNDDDTVLMTVEPSVCESCKRRSKCRYRQEDSREQCPVFRRGKGER